MIVLIDTTVFGADALCGGDAWQTLVLAAPIWGVRIVVTEVVVEEAVGNYEREVKAARTGLKGWADKRLGALGLWEALSSADNVLADGTAHYAERLRDRLGAANVQVLPIADIPHIELVKRASARRRPCNDKGDGYRDTLNWLMLVMLAEAEQKEPSARLGNGMGSSIVRCRTPQGIIEFGIPRRHVRVLLHYLNILRKRRDGSPPSKD